jgi:hypothetical protein
MRALICALIGHRRHAKAYLTWYWHSHERCARCKTLAPFDLNNRTDWERLRLLWIGRCGLGYIWRGTEHQLYRNIDGSMDSYWTHHSFPRWTQ